MTGEEEFGTASGILEIEAATGFFEFGKFRWIVNVAGVLWRSGWGGTRRRGILREYKRRENRERDK
jgi:hypothetical protein